jgi:hypothetical protein
LAAAQNEFESFQVVIDAVSSSLHGLTISLGTPLTGHGGTIAADNVTIYRGALYNVQQASDREAALGPWRYLTVNLVSIKEKTMKAIRFNPAKVWVNLFITLPLLLMGAIATWDHRVGSPANSITLASAPPTVPKIIDVSDSNTPNGLAGYVTPGETGFNISGLGSSFGSTGTVALGAAVFFTGNSFTYPQTVTAWSSSSISATISNVPVTFTHGSEIFLFVVDAIGTPSLGFPVYVRYHTPTITSLSVDTFTHGSVITVTGSYFGTRDNFHPQGQGLPFMWSDFNVTSRDIYSNPYRLWYGNTNTDQTWSNVDTRTTITNDGFYRRTNITNTLGGIDTSMGRQNEYYYSSWVRLNVTYRDSDGQVKFFRQWSSGTPEPPNWYPANEADSTTANTWTFHFENHVPEVINACEDYDDPPSVSGNQWVFFEMYMRRASTPGARDGEMWFKINNHLVFDWYKNFSISQPVPCPTNPPSYNQGEFNGTGDYAGDLRAGASYAYSWTVGSYVDSDDIYFDATQARVMVGNSPTFRGSTAFEMQIPIAWTDNAITVRLNRGAYSDLRGRWLYVVDRYGIVNENGFELGSTACTLSFSDVQPADYFYQAVLYLYCRGAISGYADGTFRPFNATTRGQLSKIVVLARGWSLQCPTTSHFSDVPPGTAFYCFVETAYSRGIISGYADGTFRPNNNITRGQLCKVIVLALNWTIYTPPTPTFADVPLGYPFYPYIETAYNHDIISGYSCDPKCLEFRPGNNATRGQISKVTYQAITAP